MKKIIIGIGATLMIVGLVILFMDSVSKNERIECQKWQKQAKEYPAYYLVKWQYDQCLTYGINIDTKIINN